jgi:hypothetical protein
MTCSCIRIDCNHVKGQCEEPPVIRGGICVSCRWFRQPFVKCPLCGEPERREDIVGGVCLTCAEGITFSLNARRASIVVKP